jgi:hypothetical protein
VAPPGSDKTAQLIAAGSRRDASGNDFSLSIGPGVEIQSVVAFPGAADEDMRDVRRDLSIEAPLGHPEVGGGVWAAV